MPDTDIMDLFDEDEDPEEYDDYHQSDDDIAEYMSYSDADSGL
jgi:hypothetical protein